MTNKQRIAAFEIVKSLSVLPVTEESYSKCTNVEIKKFLTKFKYTWDENTNSWRKYKVCTKWW